MCGIAGWASRRAVDSDALCAMRDALAHRGPDAAQTWVAADRRLGLAHRRLAIIDLTPAGLQPMWHHSRRCAVVFNGEIYNFRELRAVLEGRGHAFTTATDTEVILAGYLEWGADAIAKLNGMFAFALYDPGARLLWLARDRAGKKPVYFAPRPSDFLFASELRALRLHPAIPADPDPLALNEYLARGCVGGARALLKGVRKVQAGHVLRLDLDTLDWREWPFCEMPSYQPSEAAGRDLVAGLGERLEAAVRRRLVSDVPLGILLSGGVDSTLVATAAARAGGPRLKTFTIVGDERATGGECARARRVASLLGTAHTELPAAECALTLDEALNAGDEPNGDSSFFPTLVVSRLARRHVTVALGGDGGDELFGGYDHYRWTLQYLAGVGRLPLWLRRIPAAAARLLPPGTRGRSTLCALALPPDRFWAGRTMFFDAAMRRSILRPDVLAHLGADLDAPERLLARTWPDGHDTVARMMRADFTHFLRDDVLAKVDRASMAVSLEVRCPWLDPELIEFAFRDVPSDRKVTSERARLLPRALLGRWLPPDLDFGRKQGFSVPLEAWLRGRWRPELERPMSALDEYVRPGVVQRLARGIMRGRSNGARWYALAVLDAWLTAPRRQPVALSERVQTESFA